MEEHNAPQGPEHTNSCRDTRTFDRLLLLYILAIIAISFYALLSSQ
jgi:hypothetical protein